MVTGLTPDNQRFLIQAVATGVFKSEEDALNQAVYVLREATQTDSTMLGKLPPSQDANRESTDEWIARIRAWSERHAAVDWPVDDSRESIY